MNPNRRTHKGRALVLAGAAALGVGVGAATIASAAPDTSTTTETVVVDDTGTGPQLPVIGDGTQAPTDGNDPAGQPPLGQPPADGQRPDPASLPNGPGETVLTGDTAAKVTAAAQAAQPGATVIRVETDTNGHTYEAHLQLADGSYTTLYFDESFSADGSDAGFGAGPGGPGHGHGGPGHHGQPPADGTAPADTTSADTTPN